MLKVVGIQSDFNAIEQIFNHLCVSTDWNTLIESIEVIVVKGESNRKSLYDESRKLLAVTSPLLFSVALNELLIDITANERDSLLLEIFWLAGDFLFLLLNLCSSLLRCHHTPHLVEGVHVKWHRVKLSLVVGYRAVCEAVELSKLCDVVPDPLVIGVEYVGSVHVYIDALLLFGVDISCYVRTLVHNKH